VPSDLCEAKTIDQGKNRVKLFLFLERDSTLCVRVFACLKL